MYSDYDSDESAVDHKERGMEISTQLRCGTKRLRLTMNLESEDDEWEKWLFEDIAAKAGLHQRSVWVHEMFRKRDTDGEFVRVCIPYRQHPEKFFKYFRMSVQTFDYILANIQQRITKHSLRPSIGPMHRLAVTLRYLATGESFQTLSDSFLISPYTISLIVKEVCTVIYEEFVDKYMPVPTPADFMKVAADFEDLWNFPNVIGAIDGKHIRIKCPPKSGTMFYNYKGFYSVVLQAVADSHYRFLFIDVGAYGKQGDGGTFQASSLNPFLQDERNFPEDRIIPGIKFRVPYLFVCDDAYPLRWNMLKPYSQAKLTPAQHIFNGRLSRARRCVECSFGILANKWRILFRDIEANVDTACDLVKCLTVLHNIIIDREGVDTLLLDGVQKKLTSRASLTGVRSGRRYNRSSEPAKKLRAAFTEYFISDEGSVPWQQQYVK